MPKKSEEKPAKAEKTESPEQTAVVVAPPAPMPMLTEVQERIDDMLANRQHVIEKVKPLLIDQVDIYTLEGMKKPSLGKPGAEKLAAIFGLRASFKIDEETMKVIGNLAGERQYVAYICTLTHNNAFAGEGRGATFIEYERTNYRNVNANALTPEIRAKIGSKEVQEKQGKFGIYYRVKDGTVFDPLALNKSIKMAQKSAFVDAVIRTTGMSDLFTQDVEDMDRDQFVDAGPAPAARQPTAAKAKTADAQPAASGSDEPFAGENEKRRILTFLPQYGMPRDKFEETIGMPINSLTDKAAKVLADRLEGKVKKGEKYVPEGPPPGAAPSEPALSDEQMNAINI